MFLMADAILAFKNFFIVKCYAQIIFMYVICDAAEIPFQRIVTRGIKMMDEDFTAITGSGKFLANHRCVIKFSLEKYEIELVRM